MTRIMRVRLVVIIHFQDPRITARWFHSECINAVHHRVLICYPFKLKICRYDQFTLYHAKNKRTDNLSTNEIIETVYLTSTRIIGEINEIIRINYDTSVYVRS